MSPYQALVALRRAQEEIDEVVSHLSVAAPRYWRGPASRAYDQARESLIAHAMATKSQLAHAEWAMVQFVAETAVP